MKLQIHKGHANPGVFPQQFIKPRPWQAPVIGDIRVCPQARFLLRFCRPRHMDMQSLAPPFFCRYPLKYLQNKFGFPVFGLHRADKPDIHRPARRWLKALSLWQVVIAQINNIRRLEHLKMVGFNRPGVARQPMGKNLHQQVGQVFEKPAPPARQIYRAVVNNNGRFSPQKHQPDAQKNHQRHVSQPIKNMDDINAFVCAFFGDAQPLTDGCICPATKSSPPQAQKFAKLLFGNKPAVFPEIRNNHLLNPVR